MSELTDRLRAAANNFRIGPHSLLVTQAADRIEELEADIDQCPFHGPVTERDEPERTPMMVEAGLVWVWLQGADPPCWEMRGTGFIDERSTDDHR